MNEEQKNMVNRLRQWRKMLLQDMFDFQKLERRTRSTNWEIRNRKANFWFKEFVRKLDGDILDVTTFFEKMDQNKLNKLLKQELEADEEGYW